MNYRELIHRTRGFRDGVEAYSPLARRRVNGPTLNGDDFKRQHFSDQVSGHEDAVSLFQRYAKGGENATLKIWASTTSPILGYPLEMARSLYKTT